MSIHHPLVGIVANPDSARDVRRLVANASGMQVAERANIIQRALAGLGSVGVSQVVMMPDRGGISALVQRAVDGHRAVSEQPWPALRFLDMPVQGTVADTLQAVDTMVGLGVRAIIVLGGDGTHRAVASRCGATPIAGLSTGTNNVFPEFREPTITGIAVGLVATGAVPVSASCTPNKILRVQVKGSQRTLALVDVCLTREIFVGARALWKSDTFDELFVTFAEPDAIGLSAVAGLLHPVSRSADHGLHVRLAPVEACDLRLRVPIAPGLVTEVGVAEFTEIQPEELMRVRSPRGTVALDGEKEIEFKPSDEVTVWLETDAVRTIDVNRVMAMAAEQQFFVTRQPEQSLVGGCLVKGIR